MTAQRESIRAHLDPHQVPQWDNLWAKLLAPLPDKSDPEPDNDDADAGELPDAA